MHGHLNVKPHILHSHFLQINQSSTQQCAAYFNMSVLQCGSQIAAVSKQILFQCAVKLHGHSFQDNYVKCNNNNFTSSSYCFQLPSD